MVYMCLLNLLLIIDRILDIIGITDVSCLNEDGPEAWHVQVFRSIDSNSVKGFPKDPKDATSRVRENFDCDLPLDYFSVNLVYEANKILMKKIEDDQFLDLMTLKTEVRSACKEPYRVGEEYKVGGGGKEEEWFDWIKHNMSGMCDFLGVTSGGFESKVGIMVCPT
ncbi:Phospholipase D beta 1 [Camellia lanceoleosa]|uniref:Phospholipase D beta 1 n=1 Tax=Camellia lanceoleosa TaxID=1840588 RepID=A0ACC0FAS7_9ERIC|nr:Phospholipase D beta 1 [Camellia lanceoleosa]